MAAELFKPFIIRKLIERGIVKTVKSAKKLVDKKEPVIWDILENVLVDARPRVAMFTPNDKEVWVSAEIGGTVKVINPSTKEVTHTIGFEIPGVNEESIQPVGVRHTNDGKYTFVAVSYTHLTLPTIYSV